MNRTIPLVAPALVGMLALSGCMPNSGSTTRSTDPDAPRGSGTAEVSWPLGRQTNPPSDDDVRAAQSGPTPPARGK